MQKYNDTLTIKETLGEVIWSNPEELPAGEEFQETFKVRENSSMRGSPKLVIYCTLISKRKAGDIHFDSRIFAYLNTHKIYIGFDKFKIEEEGSP
eukprot:5320572-Ditylum_brightwellii.AAC.1